tara:strand:+ start:190 stop:327 length:138 start_codon:yes stop_codon:yes gene_type:complete
MLEWTEDKMKQLIKIIIIEDEEQRMNAFDIHFCDELDAYLAGELK